MPAMHYTLRWPDASETTAYSPSLIIQDYFEPGRAYRLDDFAQRLRAATAIANDRVQAKFGFVCSRANDQQATLLARIAQFAPQPQAEVTVLSFGPAD